MHRRLPGRPDQVAGDHRGFRGLGRQSRSWLIVTPGQDTLYILGRSIGQGRRIGVASALGVGAGTVVHTDSGLAHCPSCGDTLDFRVGAGKLELGYTYWSASMHFEAISSVPVAGLRVIKAESALAFQLGETVYPVPAAAAIRHVPQGDSP